MACVNMFNNEQQAGLHPTMGPRISFSNDFVDNKQQMKHENSYKEAPVSSDFEFSVSNYAMISADELILKGKLLPLKEHCAKTTTTLRDKLLAEVDDYEDVFPRLTKNKSWWKERLGLKRSQIAPTKSERNCEVLERIDETKSSEMMLHDQIYMNGGNEIGDDLSKK